MKQNLSYHTELEILLSCTHKALHLLRCCHVTKNCLFFTSCLQGEQQRCCQFLERRELRCDHSNLMEFTGLKVLISVTSHHRLGITPQIKTAECLLSGFLLGPVENSSPHGYGNVQTPVGNLELVYPGNQSSPAA